MRPDLLALAAKLSARDESFALVTVVRREPPSSARVGDAALVTASGEYHGWAGGGCTREAVMRESLRAIADGEPRLLSLSPSGNAGAPRPGMRLLPMACESGGTVEIYVEPVLPAPRLVLFGATPAVEALARIGEAMGYRVERSPDAPAKGAHVLIATMGDEDLELLQKVLGRGPGLRRRRREPQALRARARDARRLRRAAHGARARLRAGRARPGRAHAGGDRAQRHGADRPAAPRASKDSTCCFFQRVKETLDPICGMSVAVATARHTAEVKGTKYYFCCAGCRSKFLQREETR